MRETWVRSLGCEDPLEKGKATHSSILAQRKSRTQLSNFHLYGCESWTVKKAEHQSIDASELWCWRRLLRVPWTARKSNQSILKEISPEYSLEGLMLKLKLQYFGHLMQRTDSLGKTLMLAKIEGRRRRGQQRMKWLDGITDSMTWVWPSSGRWWRTGKPGVLQSMGSQGAGHDWVIEQQKQVIMVMWWWLWWWWYNSLFYFSASSGLNHKHTYTTQ